MNKFLRLPTLLIWLTSLWVALWADLTVGNVLGGLIVALVVVGVARPTGVTGLERTNFRPISALVFAAYFLWQLVKANLVVAWEIITPGLKIHRAIIAVPMHTTSAGVVTLIANSTTLTPGTVTVHVGEKRSTDGGSVERILFVHVLHFRDVESVRRDVMKLEWLAIKAFGQRDELSRVEAALNSTSNSTPDGKNVAR
jgi:multicomponent Na+:H+ antiporter subunit E